MEFVHTVYVHFTLYVHVYTLCTMYTLSKQCMYTVYISHHVKHQVYTAKAMESASDAHFSSLITLLHYVLLSSLSNYSKHCTAHVNCQLLYVR